MCWVVVLRHFISENIEIIRSDKKKGSPLPPPASNEPELVLPWGVLSGLAPTEPSGECSFC